MELWDNISTYARIMSGLILLVLVLSFLLGWSAVHAQQQADERKAFCIEKGFEGAVKIRGSVDLIDFCYDQKGQLFLKDKIR